jgi:hypothetical protein
MGRHSVRSAAAVALACLMAVPQAPAAEPPPFGEAELDQMVAPIALFPDALLSQMLMAATYPAAQGAAADGGARGYLSGGRLVNGFAAVAWPARYGETGVMTFTINHDGVVHQADLGPDTAAAASALALYDPDPRWVALPSP